jgi:hypothetical protein
VHDVKATRVFGAGSFIVNGKPGVEQSGAVLLPLQVAEIAIQKWLCSRMGKYR